MVVVIGRESTLPGCGGMGLRRRPHCGSGPLQTGGAASCTGASSRWAKSYVGCAPCSADLDIENDVDVASGRIGVWAHLVGGLGDHLGDVPAEASDLDTERHGQPEPVFGDRAKAHLGSHGGVNNVVAQSLRAALEG